VVKTKKVLRRIDCVVGRASPGEKTRDAGDLSTMLRGRYSAWSFVRHHSVNRNDAERTKDSLQSVGPAPECGVHPPSFWRMKNAREDSKTDVLEKKKQPDNLERRKSGGHWGTEGVRKDQKSHLTTSSTSPWEEIWKHRKKTGKKKVEHP